MAERHISRKKLEMMIEQVLPHPSPEVMLEQYTIDSVAAANVLYISAHVYNDINGRIVYDLGCGSGRLALGAVILGARHTVGVDIDALAIKTARENSISLGISDRINWIISDIDCVDGKADTVIQNPPFGVQVRGTDIRFLEKAIKISHVTYSLHKRNENTRRFIKEITERHDGTIDNIIEMSMVIPHLFDFHYKKHHLVEVDLYRIKSKGGFK
ncbi:MAG: METTL5 family protein [Promethearchaeota archaeon]